MRPHGLGVAFSTWAVAQAQVVQWDVQHRRIDARHPSLSPRAESTFEEIIQNGKSPWGYFADVQVGKPAQNITLQLDTGSSDIWIPWSGATICDKNNKCTFGSYDPENSTCFEQIGSNLFDITYVDGSYAKGEYFRDQFALGGATIKNLTMGLGTRTDIAHGLIGVGYVGNEALTDLTDRVYPNLPVAMADEGFINTIAYSIWLNDLDASSGSFLFGGIDSGKYLGKMTRVQILSESDGTYVRTTIPLTSLVATSPSGTDNITSECLPIKVVLDSGATLTYMPQDLVEQTWKEVGAVYMSEFGLAVLPCSHSKHQGNFTFGFAGSKGPTITVAMDELLVDLTDGNMPEFPSGKYKGQDVCAFGIQNDTSNVYLFGATFLRSAYVVYDLVNHEIGIATTDFNSTESNIVAFESYGAKIPSATLASYDYRTTSTSETTENGYTAADGFQEGGEQTGEESGNGTNSGGGSESDGDDEEDAASSSNISNLAITLAMLAVVFVSDSIF